MLKLNLADMNGHLGHLTWPDTCKRRKLLLLFIVPGSSLMLGYITLQGHDAYNSDDNGDDVYNSGDKCCHFLVKCYLVLCCSQAPLMAFKFKIFLDAMLCLSNNNKMINDAYWWVQLSALAYQRKVEVYYRFGKWFSSASFQESLKRGFLCRFEKFHSKIPACKFVIV